MMNYNGFNPYIQNQPLRYSPLKIFPVSNILEANSTPVESLDPIFFYNKAENLIYKKQIDGTGAAPIQVYKFEPLNEPLSDDKKSGNMKTYEKELKAINDRLDGLYELLMPKQEIKEVREDKKDV